MSTNRGTLGEIIEDAAHKQKGSSLRTLVLRSYTSESEKLDFLAKEITNDYHLSMISRHDFLTYIRPHKNLQNEKNITPIPTATGYIYRTNELKDFLKDLEKLMYGKEALEKFKEYIRNNRYRYLITAPSGDNIDIESPFTLVPKDGVENFSKPGWLSEVEIVYTDF